jgi:hypothetical protein
MLAVTPNAPPEIHLTIPGTDFLRLARLAVADVGSRVGMSIEDLEDLRIAVDELCLAMATGSADAPIELSVVLVQDGVEVRGACADDGSPFELSELGQVILDAVVDDLEFGRRDGSREFRFSKRSEAQ